MKIILSPAKKMIVDTDNLAPVELPVYIDKTAEVLNWMKSKSKEELKAMPCISPECGNRACISGVICTFDTSASIVAIFEIKGVGAALSFSVKANCF